jgi:hypothetical protein
MQQKQHWQASQVIKLLLMQQQPATAVRYLQTLQAQAAC